MKPTQVSLFSPTPKARRIAREDTPTYRLGKLGPEALTFEELLAVLLNDRPTGLETAAAVVARFPRPEMLRQAHPAELGRIHGLTPGKIARLQASFELAARARDARPGQKQAIHSPAEAAGLVQYAMSALDHEELWLLLLDTRSRVIDLRKLYRGSVNSSQVRVGEVFREAILRNAPNLIVIHNHPSGDATPSPDDVALTRAIVQAGKGLDIDVLDHLVIGQGQWTSLKERGLGFA